MGATETYVEAGHLKTGDVLCEADGFLVRVRAARHVCGRIHLELVPVYGSMTWPGRGSGGT
jgi:hypothetical protein